MPFLRPGRGIRSKAALRVAAGLAAALVSQFVNAFEPFVVRDIRLDGVQRTEPGTVFGYLPVKVGELLTQDKAAAAVRALFATGFFKDVRLEVQGDVLVVLVDERPAIASVTVTGTTEFDEDTVKRALRDNGLAESRIFDRAVLERAEQELKRQYLSRGKYAVRVTSTVTPLERNRVGISLAVEEGESARISSIRIIGNKAFTEKQLLEEFKLATSGWFSWYTKSDRYAREKLSGDLEALRSFYLDRGYLEFAVDSTEVSISPDREDVNLTIGISEGGVYRVSAVRFAGQLLGRGKEFEQLMLLAPGETFSGKKLADSQKAILERLGALGYAFASVNPVPQVDRDKREVAFDVLVDPGRRVYVRRINVAGNSRTRDEVVRRELRQFEDSWYDSEKIRVSRERIGRLGYFTDVRIDSVPVAGAPDQVDLNVVVTEQASGAISVGVGFSSAEKVIFSGAINQQNFLGTGKSLGLTLNTSKLSRNISVSYTDPYYTPEGISRSFDLYTRLFNAAEQQLGDYQWRSSGVGLRYGIPYTEVDRIFFGLVVEANELKLGSNAPLRFKDYVADFGSQSAALLATVGWRRDSRDSAFAPTRGRYQNATLEFSIPALDLRYGRATYTDQWYWPVSRDYTIALNADLGHGRSFGGQPYPLFKNFYAGGIGSVRGYAQSSLGPRDPVDDIALGGQTKVIGSVEFIFPLPGTGKDRSFRSFVFFDAGNVYQQGSIDLGDLRYSFGLGLNWASPIGPLKLSVGFPINRATSDRTQRMQFQVGTGF
ncbi:MAG: outer membrane protein assembly factor BamA [Burkholderiaceae bacterium]|nr:outer membrane protein assembly factor BamA [Burkholderiaceae bacterium]